MEIAKVVQELFTLQCLWEDFHHRLSNEIHSQTNTDEAIFADLLINYLFFYASDDSDIGVFSNCWHACAIYSRYYYILLAKKPVTPVAQVDVSRV